MAAAATAGAAAPLLPEQWPRVKAVLVGSGSDGMGGAGISDAVLGLVGKDQSSDVRVLYIGTPTYYLPGPTSKQCAPFADAGCVVSELELIGESTAVPSADEIAAMIRGADVILVSGGNPLFAVALWEAHGVPSLLREAMEAGAVICGGSCGLICWFTAGHSDSADPASYKTAMLGGATTQESGAGVAAPAPHAIEGGDSWDYIRCPCLGLLPGLICPHHDRVQSNGVLRATDFDKMMLRHPGEYGIAVDHWAALILDGAGGYSVYSVPDKPGSVSVDGSFVSDGSGTPGVWVKEVQDGAVQTTLLPRTGAVASLLRAAQEVVDDPRVPGLRLANPAV
jgi:dipeptidase E